MGKFGMGQSVPRTEDPRLLTGRGRYVSDTALGGQVFGYTVRSPHAHAHIRSIDTGAAKAAPGILAVYTHEDVVAQGLGRTQVHFPPRTRPDGAPDYDRPHPGLVGDTVRCIGDPVAFVVAETSNLAKDAAEMVVVDYDILPVVTSTAAATDPDSPRIWEDFPDNISNISELGDKAAVAAAFAGAAHVVSERFVINRVSPNPMETRGCVGTYDAADGRFTLYGDTQTPHISRRQLAESIFRIPETQMRVVARDIGGAFGLKEGHYPEVRLCLMAARDLGRPVKWVCERSEAFLADDHARDQITEAQMALDENGGFLALRVKTTCNMGAYISGFSSMVPTFSNLGSLAGVYTTPAIHVQVACVFTNTQPTGPYRGAGRPEANYVLERLIDIAALEIGIDRVELRRRNIIPAAAMPYQTGLIFKYDCGEFEKNMDLALSAADAGNFEARRAAAAAEGKLLGLGIANMVEHSGGGFPEQAEIRFDATGSVKLLVGTKAQGQGHETMYKIMLSDMLGLDSDDILVVDDDTDQVSFGSGTIGSRSAMIGGAALRGAADRIIAKGLGIAAHLLEAAETDLKFDNGWFRVAGTDKAIELKEVAKTAFLPRLLPPDIEPGFYERATYFAQVASYPNGCHVCEVEIDRDTGRVRIVNYVAVDDVGTVINQLTLDGQIHGGIAQGAGQALMENIHHDPETGQLLTGSFLDYTMPRADDFCAFDIASNPVPSKTNPLGIKGAGEAGTTGALPAVVNAVNQALAPLGVRHLDMPLTAERVWRCIKTA
ncbi:MAG: carbon monoxide dehydrogenase [Rhodospirillaceae bacterium]|jgi:carbon-monoxide dehydrogenase large subunit|nr:carbon monoxide dehydrogenase [Rhodospirillaceae bacterium]